ncbi:unnamed protein product [Nippostrongylus brasiliensis]|uniref:Protein kinase domain-containing protein n=1 Tax=Nippostrongylus brasiliensis TaxID=27835 RepID=A0A158QXD6_NIPBR|nr:unnamed protein product [Nippostrongylus brasiliensis]
MPPSPAPPSTSDATLVTDQCSVSYMTPWATVVALTTCYLLVILWICKNGKKMCLPVPDNLFPYQKQLKQLKRELSRYLVDDNSIEIFGTPLAHTAQGTLFRGTVVPRVKHRTTERVPVAVKVSHPNPKHSVALLEESARICRLSHPNISRILAISHLSFAVLRPVVTVEWLAGGNLADYFEHQIRGREERERPLVLLRDVLEVLAQVSAALKHFHEVLGDVAHGAVTTENVQLTSRDLRRCTVKLSCLYPATMSRLPPEIVCSTERNPKRRQESDIWMFGILCWESVTLGAEPHYQRTNEEIQRWSLAMECLSEAHRRPRFVGATPTLVDRVQQLRTFYAQSMDCLYPVPNIGNCTCLEHKCKKLECHERE